MKEFIESKTDKELNEFDDMIKKFKDHGYRSSVAKAYLQYDDTYKELEEKKGKIHYTKSLNRQGKPLHQKLLLQGS
eukprot:2656434-Amphidinium_carterae.1